jgi:hypothetical protein
MSCGVREGSWTAPSFSQQQVSERLRHMGLSVEDEVCCPKSGYSIDMIVHDSGRVMGDERSSIAGMWAVDLMVPGTSLQAGSQMVPPC